MDLDKKVIRMGGHDFTGTSLVVGGIVAVLGVVLAIGGLVAGAPWMVTVGVIALVVGGALAY